MRLLKAMIYSGWYFFWCQMSRRHSADVNLCELPKCLSKQKQTGKPSFRSIPPCLPRQCRAVPRLLATDLHVATSWINCHLDSTGAPRPDLKGTRFPIRRPRRSPVFSHTVFSFRVPTRALCHVGETSPMKAGDAFTKVKKRKVNIYILRILRGWQS